MLQQTTPYLKRATRTQFGCNIIEVLEAALEPKVNSSFGLNKPNQIIRSHFGRVGHRGRRSFLKQLEYWEIFTVYAKAVPQVFVQLVTVIWG